MRVKIMERVVTEAVFIKNEQGEYWTGTAWSSAINYLNGPPVFGKKYSPNGALAVIKKRFGKGVRKTDRDGRIYHLSIPDIFGTANFGRPSRANGPSKSGVSVLSKRGRLLGRE